MKKLLTWTKFLQWLQISAAEFSGLPVKMDRRVELYFMQRLTHRMKNQFRLKAFFLSKFPFCTIKKSYCFLLLRFNHQRQIKLLRILLYTSRLYQNRVNIQRKLISYQTISKIQFPQRRQITLYMLLMEKKAFMQSNQKQMERILHQSLYRYMWQVKTASIRSVLKKIFLDLLQ